MKTEHQETPEYVKMSMAAALTLGFKDGRFYRNAKLRCINLLLVYSGGCSAKCAYCGLAGKRISKPENERFIRVAWPVYPFEDILEKMKICQYKFNRICISMVTRKNASQDVIYLIDRIKALIDKPVSVLICPTVTTIPDLISFKESGADKVGIAVDAATAELFDKYRGNGVGGPHQWKTYWETYKRALEIFGINNAGVHLIAGLGETEKEMCEAVQKAHSFGGNTHLFSFYPEIGSQLELHQPPPIGQYRRIQLARYLIDKDMAKAADFEFDDFGRIRAYGVPSNILSEIIHSGLPFMTSGCIGNDGNVACNRPYANFPPPNIRNYPFNVPFRDG
ncbi:Radical SAM domain protein [uncultured Desulfobacterium sp.]|uniref:Radical SAM domain protein n=1 Tax=uncultured Desulfobacterium sp. TaxID=201089 RepID=A0A445MZ44_9BACT|nr:Radical SAM domain protein [uncultured Desulfobacterium sp.]